MKIITGYVINPLDRTVVPRDFQRGNLDEIYRAIGCQCFDVAGTGYKDDGVYVDDEGLINGAVDRYGMFYLPGAVAPLAGLGVVFGVTASGNSASPKEPFEIFQRRVKWVDGIIHLKGTVHVILHDGSAFRPE